MSKIKLTADDYIQAGAWTRLLKTIFSEYITAVCPVHSSLKDTDKLIAMERKLDVIISSDESTMYRNHPEFSADFKDIFYGDIRIDCPRNPIDAQVQHEAFEILRELIKAYDEAPEFM